MFRNSVRDLSQKLTDIAYEVIDNDESLGNRILEVAHEMKAHTFRRAFPPDNLMASLQGLMQDLKIPYAIIGSTALAVHGQLRETEDIDTLVEIMPAADKIADPEYMRKYGFYKSKSHTGAHLILDTTYGGGYIELLLADSPLRKRAIKTAQIQNVLGSNVPVVSAAMLIGLKVQAMTANPSRRLKDHADIVSIMESSKPDLAEVKTLLSPQEVEVLEGI